MCCTKNNRESFTVSREITAGTHRRLYMLKIAGSTWVLWNGTLIVKNRIAIVLYSRYSTSQKSRDPRSNALFDSPRIAR